MRKLPKAIIAGTAMLLAAAAPALADNYYGGWTYRGPTLILGDSTDGTGLFLANSPRYCGRSASRGSASIRSMLDRSNYSSDSNINWWIDESCRDGYLRVCIVTSTGENGCNTYRDLGWHPYSP